MTQPAAPSSSPNAAFRAGARRRPRAWPRRTLAVAIVLLLLVVAVRVALDPIAQHYTRRGLAGVKGMNGDFQSVHVTVFPPRYELQELEVIQSPGGERPLLEVKRAVVSVDWRRLLRGQLVAELRLDEPEVELGQRAAAEAEADERKLRSTDIAPRLEALIPARIERIEVRRGTFAVRRPGDPAPPELRVRRIELAAENLATRAELTRGRPATVSLSAVLGESGDLSGFASADLFADGLDAAGHVALRGWNLAELYEPARVSTGLQLPQGTLDLFAEFEVEGGVIRGGVKPVLRNVEVRPTEDTIGNWLAAWAADAALDLFSDDVPGRDAVATVVPIHGRLDDPKAQLWPTVLSIIRNAFVQGIASGFAHLPPPRSEEKEGVLTQAAHALQKKHGPVEAQPQSEGGREP